MYLKDSRMRSRAQCSCFPKVLVHFMWFFTGVSSDFPPLLLPLMFESCQLSAAAAVAGGFGKCSEN